MAAYISVIVLQALCLFLALFGMFGKAILKKAGKWEFKPEPISTAQKVVQLLIAIGYAVLIYFATIGTFVGNLPLVLFVIQVTTTSVLYLKHLPKRMTSDDLSGTMFTISVAYAIGILVAYTYMGLVCARVVG
ncbi:hypothetical protein KASHIRA_01640 [Serratia phage vB_SmaM-Kashira]|nr:hypothetical protein [Acinetobacter phage ABPH49]URC22738.1 hypothetical protein KASHIRA_01640 [Serratia phage vB_SmaM-Kashira]